MATSRNQNKDPKGADGGGTAHSNYTAQRIGNDHGNIKFGHVHKDAGTTSGVMLETTDALHHITFCLLYTSPSPRDKRQSRMPSSA